MILMKTIKITAILCISSLVIFNLLALRRMWDEKGRDNPEPEHVEVPKNHVIELDSAQLKSVLGSKGIAMSLDPKFHTSADATWFTRTVETDHEDDFKIPRIVHLTWKTRAIPDENIKWISRWKETNPNWEVWFWTDVSSRKVIATKFPHLLNVYDRYKNVVNRADAMRYIVLYEFGGVWADLDVEPLKSLDPIRDLYPSVLSQESEVHAKSSWNLAFTACNAFMATRRRHPFFKFIMDMLEVNQKEDHPVKATGPIMVTRMYLAYEDLYNRLGNGKSRNRVFIAPSQTFLPTTDYQAMNLLRKKCREETIEKDFAYLCDKYLDPRYKNGPTNESYTDHHWWHSWIGNKDYRKYTDIEKVLPAVVFPEQQGKF